MFRSMLLLAAALVLAAPLYAIDGKESLRLKAAAALALTAPSLDCGECIFDEDEARGRALREHKPLVLIVGNCSGRGKQVFDAGGVACIVTNYSRDGRPADESRIIVLKPSGADFDISARLPSTATADDIRKAVGEATPEPPKKMPATAVVDWDIHADAKPTVTPTKRYRQVCVGGVCRLEEIIE